jgi:hypothetical protein
LKTLNDSAITHPKADENQFIARPFGSGIAQWNCHNIIEFSSFLQLIQEHPEYANPELLEFAISPEVQKYTTRRVHDQREPLGISIIEPEKVSLGKVCDRILSQTLEILRHNVI